MKPIRAYINNQWIESKDTYQTLNPANGSPVSDVGRISRKETAGAVAAAHGALPAWRDLTGKARGAYLRDAAAALLDRADEIAELITLENGKPLAQSQGEVNMTADHLGWFAEEARRAYGRTIPHQVDGKRNLTVKCPIGVVGAISPWNFPLVLAARKVAPALAAGCPVVLKPAGQTPACAHALAECFAAVNLPPGVFNLVIGKASEIGAEFLNNPLCRKITFTGSTPVGRTLIRGAADQIKPLSLELGGHAPALVFEDVDLEAAVDAVMIAKFRNIGQSCIAANRIYVQQSIHDAFVERLVEKTRALKVGDGMEPGVDIGPLINREAVETAEAHVLDAVEGGAKLHCGGKRMQDTNGSFFEPAVVSGVKMDALCMREETFAPVAPVAAFDTEEEAVDQANRSEYGLAAYAFTRDLSRALRLSESLEAGTIGINDGSPSTSQSPFGGLKQSGWGRELGCEGMDAFLETKHVSVGGVL